MTPRQCRELCRVAELEALAEMTAATLGQDPKSTRRTLTALVKAAEAKLARVRATMNGQAPDGDPLAAVRAAVAREKARAEAERAARAAPSDSAVSAKGELAAPSEIAAPDGAEEPGGSA